MIKFTRVSKDIEIGRIGRDIELFAIQPHITITHRFVLLNRLPGMCKVLGIFDTIDEAKIRAYKSFDEWLERCELAAI